MADGPHDGDRGAQAALHAVLDVVEDGLVVTDERGCVVAVNEGFLHIIGLERAQVEGVAVDRLARRMPALFDGAALGGPALEAVPAAGADAARRIELDDGRVFERVSRATEGAATPRAWRYRPLSRPSGPHASTSMEPVDPGLATALAQHEDPSQLMQAAMDAARETSRAAFGAFLYRAPAPVPAGADPVVPATGPEPTEAGDATAPDVCAPAALPTIVFSGVAASHREDFDLEQVAAEFDLAWCAARTLRFADLSAHAPHAGSVARGDEPRVRSLLAVPVRARDGTVVGGLFLAHPEPDVFGAHAQRAVEAVAAQVALALENLRLADGLRRATSERHELVDAARRARRESARAAHVKDEFLATLSHELRTPLTAILGWAKVLLLQHSDAATQARGLEAIARNANIQVDLIETLLDMSRIVSGKVHLDMQPTDLARVVDDALEAIRLAAEAKSIVLVRAFDPGVCRVAGDATRLQQLAWNLLSNAVKFTPRQGRVEARLATVDGEVELVVQDTGPGIEQQFLPHVFDCFRQADASTTRRHGGLGIGLAIVKQLATLHGGTATACSDGPGRGASFAVRLPCANVLPAEPGAARASARAGEAPERDFCDTDLHGLDLLVVDDQTDARELISQLLVECGASVRQAASAADALREVIARRPDVLLSDIGMPDRDGYELIREVRRLAPAEGGSVPALALTAFTCPEDRAQALAAGYQGHLAKPVQPHALASAVAALAGRPSVRETQRQDA